MRTFFRPPQRRRLLDADQDFAFFFNILQLLNPPAFTQRQNRMKHFLWNHKATILTAPHISTPFTHYKRPFIQTLLPITNVEELSQPMICMLFCRDAN
jgi:hypothetical protein